MEVEYLRGLYKRWPTKFYLGFRQGKFCSTTRKRELDRVLVTRTLSRRNCVVSTYCKKHNHVVFLPGHSDFHRKAAEKAQDCEELDFLEDCWRISRKLGEAALSGDMTKVAESLKKLKKHQVRSVLNLESERLRELISRIEAYCPEGCSELVNQLVGLKLEEE